MSIWTLCIYRMLVAQDLKPVVALTIWDVSPRSSGQRVWWFFVKQSTAPCLHLEMTNWRWAYKVRPNSVPDVIVQHGFHGHNTPNLGERKAFVNYVRLVDKPNEQGDC